MSSDSQFSPGEFANFFLGLKSDASEVLTSARNRDESFRKRLNSMYKTIDIGEQKFEIDMSKELISCEAFQNCLQFLESKGFVKKILEMCEGKEINYTEKRKVLHVALRDRDGSVCKNPQIREQVNTVLETMKAFSAKIQNGELCSYSGQEFKYCINIGIGGSDLGPKMVCQALAPFSKNKLQCYFVSNVDAAHLIEILDEVDIKSTLFIVCSKTFTTKETMMNANAAKQILFEKLGSNSDEIIAKNFCAISTNIEAAKNFGIPSDRVFHFWDWVGGRYSVWSSIGLSICLMVGYENFIQFLNGAHEMDKHFFNSKVSENVPVCMAILKIWNLNIENMQTLAVLPYDQHLEYLCSYLQQLEMESNGKTYTKENSKAKLNSSSIIFGQPGTNGQHAFYQYLHQNQQKVPSIFLCSKEPSYTDQRSKTERDIIAKHHTTLIANCIAQAEALLVGKAENEVVDELKSSKISENQLKVLKGAKAFDGGRPSTFIMYQKLTPKTLGAIVALFEHTVYVSGLLAGINSFDQYGVELGKKLATDIEKELVSGETNSTKHDLSTGKIMEYILK